MPSVVLKLKTLHNNPQRMFTIEKYAGGGHEIMWQTCLPSKDLAFVMQLFPPLLRVVATNPKIPYLLSQNLTSYTTKGHKREKGKK
jgi:hypothetical protein